MDAAMDISPPRRMNKKRTRSNEEPTSQDPIENVRPTKRPAIGLEFPLTQLRPVQPAPAGDATRPEMAMNSWRFSDDWVNKTGGLRLDSPLPTSITTEDGDISRFQLTDRAQVVHGSVQPHHLHEQHTYLPTPKESPVMPAPGTEVYEFGIKGSRLRQSHTPVESIGSREHTPPASRYDPAPFDDAIMLSPQMRPASPEKKRIYMGYREGCESCRLRVPGHHIHYI